jgi:Fe2+ transport system protein FeoA
MTIIEIKDGIRLLGVVPGESVEIISSRPAGNAVEIIYRKNDGTIFPQIIYEKDLTSIQVEDNTLRR